MHQYTLYLISVKPGSSMIRLTSEDERQTLVAMNNRQLCILCNVCEHWYTRHSNNRRDVSG